MLPAILLNSGSGGLSDGLGQVLGDGERFILPAEIMDIGSSKAGYGAKEGEVV